MMKDDEDIDMIATYIKLFESGGPQALFLLLLCKSATASTSKKRQHADDDDF